MPANSAVPNDNSAAQNGSAPAANADAWHAPFDADTKGWITGKGWDKLDANAVLPELVKGYRGAEQKFGVPAEQLLRLPGKDAKPEDWRAVWGKLGAPEKPEGYEIKAPEGDTGEFLKTATGWFHELGIPKPMAQGLAAKWTEHVGALQAADETKWNTRFDAEIGELKGDWKDKYDANMDLAKRVMKAGGWKQEELQAMERALGPKAFLAGFQRFASMVGEHRFVGGEGGNSFGISADGAKARIEALNKDVAWQTARRGGDAAKQEEWTKLHQAAYGDAPANVNLDVSA